MNPHPLASLPSSLTSRSSHQVITAPKKRRRHPDMDEVKELVNYMRDMKVESFETPYLKVKFSPDALASGLQPPTPNMGTDITSEYNNAPSDDEVSSGLRARR